MNMSRYKSQIAYIPYAVLADDLDWQVSWRVTKTEPYVHDNFRMMTVERSEPCLDWVIQLVNINLCPSLRGTDTYSSTPARGQNTAFSWAAHMKTPWHPQPFSCLFVFWLDRILPCAPSDHKGMRYSFIITLVDMPKIRISKMQLGNMGNNFVIFSKL